MMMWIAREAFERLMKRLGELEATAEWTRVRLNQCERERAMLLQRALALPIEAPELIRDDPRPLPPPGPVNGTGLPNLAGVDFDDLGDDLAQSIGVFHDEEGRIRYRG